MLPHGVRKDRGKALNGTNSAIGKESMAILSGEENLHVSLPINCDVNSDKWMSSSELYTPISTDSVLASATTSNDQP